jgi:hypothetical protein
MSIASPARRPLAAALALTVIVGGLSLAPLTAATAATPAANAATVFSEINAARSSAEVASLNSSPALTVIAQKYATTSAAKGKVTAAPTVFPADVDAESAPPVVVFSTGYVSSKANAAAAFAKLTSEIYLNATYDFGAVGYATKGTKTFVVALLADYANAPLETQFGSKPTIGGSAIVGRLFVATHHFTTNPNELSYQWRVNGVIDPDLTSFATPVLPAYKGKTLSVTVTAYKEGHTPLSYTSAKTAKVAAGTLPFKLAAYGDRNVGKVLFTYFSPSAYPAFGPTSVEYQWYRGSKKIVGATGESYTQTSNDLGKKIWVRLTATGDGLKTLVLNSSKSVLTKVPQIAYASGVSISHDAEEVIVGTALSVNKGDWDSILPEAVTTGAGITLSTQWLIDGVAVKGATGDNFTVPTTALGKAVSVRVTGKLKGHAATVRYSDTYYIYGQQFETEPSLTVSGTFAKGKTLTAKIANLPAGVKVTYSWHSFFDGQPFKSLTTKSIKVSTTVADMHGVGVAATITKKGYNPVTLYSGASDLFDIGAP